MSETAVILCHDRPLGTSPGSDSLHGHKGGEVGGDGGYVNLWFDRGTFAMRCKIAVEKKNDFSMKFGIRFYVDY